MRRTWKGCTRTRRWKVSLPAFLVMYLLAAMRAASRASLVICSFSQLHSRGDNAQAASNDRRAAALQATILYSELICIACRLTGSKGLLCCL